MVARTFTDEQLLDALRETKSPTKLAARFGISARAMVTRMRAVGVAPAKHAKDAQGVPTKAMVERSIGRISTTITDGRAVIFSDAHFQPDCISTANRALLKLLPELRPSVVVCNGDALDGASISRHPAIFGEKPHTPAAELRACQERLTEIAELSKGALRIWTLGNHDARFETFLAAQASQYEGVEGFTLKDHFPLWKPCWSYWINDDTMIKHRWKGGFSAGRANSLNAGVNIITGHTHNLAVQPITDFSPAFRHNGGTRYGVQTGTLAEPNSEQFVHYTEDNPKDWRSGFALLSFERGRLMLPELIQVCGEDEFEFRGCINKV
jgi:hypothetical protein